MSELGTSGSVVVGGAGGPVTSVITNATQAPAQTSNQTSPAQNQGDWTSGLNDELKGYVQNKGFKDPVAILDSYRNLEKLLGGPKDRLLKLPEKDDDPTWGEIYGKLGRPENPEGYKFELSKNVGDEEFAKSIKTAFHQAGVTGKQAELITKHVNQLAEASQAELAEAQQAKIAAEEAALKKEWGAAYEQNVNIAKRAAQVFGLKGEVVDQLEQAMGYSGVLKFLNQIGSRLGEDKMIRSDSQSGFNVMTPEGARSRIQALRTDADFQKRYLSGDVSAKREMDQLHQWAFGG